MKVSPDIFENTEVAYASKSNAELRKAQALFKLFGSPLLVNTGSAIANLALKLRLPVAPLFKYTVYNHFSGGETFKECKHTIAKLAESNIGVLLNYGVELKETDKDFDTALQKNIEAIDFSHKNKYVRAICVKPTSYGRFDLFEKVQNKETLSTEETAEYERVRQRFDKVCQYAHDNEVVLYMDAEESWIQDALDELTNEMMYKYNRKKCYVYNTIQLYRWDRLNYLKTEVAEAKVQGYLYGAKLVRGAYMEKERERAKELGYKSPIHTNKKGVDADFDEAVEFCLQNKENVYICVASHNEHSNLLAMQQMDKLHVHRDTTHVVFSQLYGMGDNITFNLAKQGFNTAKYLPYGPVKDVIPYLIRRAQENTSVSGQTGRELTLINREIKRRSNA
jgi:proline dehydrogenase